MGTRRTKFQTLKLALSDVLGKEYIEAVCAARAVLTGMDRRSLRRVAFAKVNFYPQRFQSRLLALLPFVGKTRCRGVKATAEGATSTGFRAHTQTALAPLSALGFLRIGEDGRLFLTSKSEHYHAPLGHGFPGYLLVEHAQLLGVPNATHNNTRGHVTRLLEQELVRTAAGLRLGDSAGLQRVLASRRMHVLNRVLNLETGSLAAEAAIKMVLSRFYRCQPDSPEPKYGGRLPVLVVIGDEEGGCQANYHGTTVVAQILRGMWPDLRVALERECGFLVRPIRPNDLSELEAVFADYETPPMKIAAFFHELVLMNYAGKRLTERFVRRAYALCRKHDVPAVVDEIQTGVWSPEMYMFREYRVRPALVALGKGFPGGEYPASRILFSAAMDTLPQFGALVTNGQEELASLAYLVTMRWAEANAEVTRAVGDDYEERLHELGRKYSEVVSAIEGRRHLAGVYFRNLGPAKAFARYLNEAGLDISVQTYKAGCPPSALTKLPLIAGYEVVDFILARMDQALGRIARPSRSRT